MNTHLLTCSSRKVTYEIINGLKVEVRLDENPYSFPLEKLFLMAARINKKRAFLFVSQVLGKHIPIKPATGLVTGALLAATYMEKVKKEQVDCQSELVEQFINQSEWLNKAPFIHEKHEPIIIGFAETATALGHAFFSAFSKAYFFHTTREWLDSHSPAIIFEEEHSHATSHRVYIDEKNLKNSREIILVDDEITTGKTALNIIRSIQAKFPRKTYTVVSILDWRSAESEQQYKDLERELGITIHTVSLVKGTISLRGELPPLEPPQEHVQRKAATTQRVSYHSVKAHFPHAALSQEGLPYMLETGRFGLLSTQNSQVNEWAQLVGESLKEMRSGARTLCLGTGEFMYIPMKIAASMGDGVKFQSTTRSPIYPLEKTQYGVQNRFSFSNPEDPHVRNFVYNIFPHKYDELFLFFEREISEDRLGQMLKQLERTNIKVIRIIHFDLSERRG